MTQQPHSERPGLKAVIPLLVLAGALLFVLSQRINVLKLSACLAPEECNDENACTTDTCTLGTCMHLPIDCDDGNACTADACNPATGCTATPINCDDGNACTADSCSNGVCEHAPIANCCDPTACTGTFCGRCDSQTCEKQCKILGCQGNTCTATTAPQTCSPSECIPGECPPATFCTQISQCAAGGGTCGNSCRPGTAFCCCSIDAESCPDGTCNGNEDCGTCPQDCGVCPTPDCCNGGVTCATGQQCNQTSCVCEATSTCGNGTCDSSETCSNCSQDCGACPPPPVCGDNQCNGTETCSSCPGDCGTCLCTTNADCDDANACTTDVCSAGICLHTQLNCDDGNACTSDSCSGGSCVFTPIPNCGTCGNGSVDVGEVCGEPGLPSCPVGQTCANCVCEGPPPNCCTGATCPAGQSCNASCQCEDPGNCCTGVSCGGGEVCNATCQCVTTGDCCSGTTCAQGEQCNQTSCVCESIVDNCCGGAICPAGQSCNATCQCEDPGNCCTGVACGVGEVCNATCQCETPPPDCCTDPSVCIWQVCQPDCTCGPPNGENCCGNPTMCGLGLVCNTTTCGCSVAFSIGDFVWKDSNSNGLQDAGEPGVAGHPLGLFNQANCAGAAIATTQSDASGFYSFTDLLAGTYWVKSLGTDPITLLHAGPNTIDNDFDPQTRCTSPGVTVGPSTADVDLGLLSVCGDLSCSPPEDCTSCGVDCGPCSCGNTTCDPGENCANCAQDCGSCLCGDGTCSGTESCESCTQDCGACICGDGTCNGTETCETCDSDCGACVCGDGSCNGTESCASCSQDCGTCGGPLCGNAVENYSAGEECDDGGICTGGSADGSACTTAAEALECSNRSGTCRPQSSDGCSSQCLLEALCGNGVLEFGEQCDDGGLCLGGTNPNAPCNTLTEEADCGPGGICVPRGGDGCDGLCAIEECTTIGTPGPVNAYIQSIYNLAGFHPGMDDPAYESPLDPRGFLWFEDQFRTRYGLYAPRGPGNAIIEIPFIGPLDNVPHDPSYFGSKWEGVFTVPHFGTYTFYFGSRDDSWILIDGTVRASFRGIHATVTPRVGSVTLSPGLHTIEIYYASRQRYQCVLDEEIICNDGIDNDEDGLLDCSDPDCTGDPACAVTFEPSLPPTLALTGPEDAETSFFRSIVDAIADFFRTVFSSASRFTAQLPPPPAQCNDGLDNDGDGATDFPADGGCVSSSDDDEHNACIDGIDNDADGAIDCADFSCREADEICDPQKNSESTPQSECEDGIDNDVPPDGKADFLGAGALPPDPKCVDRQDNSESDSHVGICPALPRPGAQCFDGIDNDGDGATDYPNDVSCDSRADTDETNPKPACYDGFDNDGDTFIDFPVDRRIVNGVVLGCTNRQDTDEFDITQCADEQDNDNDGAIDLADFSCGGDPNYGLESEPEPQCDDGLDNDGDSAIDCADFSCNPDGGTCTPLEKQKNDETNPPAQCGNGIDDDADGAIDYPEDFSCTSPNDNDETNPQSQCQDGVENDSPADGAIDCADFSCLLFDGTCDPQDNDETTPKAQCQDAIDNDGRNGIDFPVDPGCSSRQDNLEFSPPQCSDGIDNDSDGGLDFIGLDLNGDGDFTDPGEKFPDAACASSTDDNEADLITECQNGIDDPDPEDFLADELDPGCHFDRIAGNPASYNSQKLREDDNVECSDGINNDLDPAGLVDCADPNCHIGGNPANPCDDNDDSEAAGCNDGFDNDGDGLRDFPADPNCANVDDDSEIGQCQDGRDNDSDGAIDRPADFSCSSPSDDDELNPKAQCQNGFDDDLDLATDYPADFACDTLQDNNENDRQTQCQDLIDNDSDTWNNAFRFTVSRSTSLTGPNTSFIDIDASRLYVAGNGARLRRFDIPGLGNPLEISLGFTPASSVFDPAQGRAFLGLASGTITRFRVSTMATEGSLTVPGVSTTFRAAVVDRKNRFAYFASAGNPSVLAKINIDSFTVVGTITLTGVNGINSGIIDVERGYAYFGTNGIPGRVARVNLKTFALEGTLDLDPGENALPAAAIDTARGFAYFGTSTSPARVVKVNLNTFTRVGSITFPTGENSVTAMVLDPVDGAVYAGVNGRVVKISQSLQRLHYQGANQSPDSAAIDSERGNAYFGSDFSRTVMEYTLGDPGCGNLQDNSEQPTTLPCNDGVDNDADGFFDRTSPAIDVSCSGSFDRSEQFPERDCFDFFDNDTDFASDFPKDFSCSDTQDDDELLPRAQCQNAGFFTNPLCPVPSGDDDCDTLADFTGTPPAFSNKDPGCFSRQDNDERNPPQCNDGADNDNDGAIDFPADISCNSITDNNEAAPESACQDAADNDTDLAFDYPEDFSCVSQQDNALGPPPESTPKAQCQDGTDNDGDGAIDLADFACSCPQDNREGDALAACQNKQDDDGDRRTDTADPGCHSDDDAANPASYNNQRTSEVNSPRCGNGVVDRAEEQCDNGLNNSDAFPDACRTNCLNARCGDGVRDTGEQCDDGNTAKGDGCSDICSITQQCNDTVDNVETPEDTFIDCADPGCHTDGNAAVPITCDTTDDTEGGNTPRCGDGATDASLSEECDDGCLAGVSGTCEPADNGDGCSSVCRLECSGIPCFALRSSSSESENTFAIAIGDFDGDEDLDYLAGNGLNQPTRMYRNDGTANFTAAWASPELPDTQFISLGDIDGDADLDYVSANGNSFHHSVYRNDGTGNFTLAATFSVNTNPRANVLGDLDGDGDLDLLAAAAGGPPIRFYENDGAGNFTFIAAKSFGVNSPRALALADLDSDGDLDAIAEAKVYRNDGNGTFTLFSSIPGTDVTLSIALGDLDNDGDLDYLAGNAQNQPNRVYKNDGTGNFTLFSSSAEADNTQSVALGDLDNDGDLDYIAGNITDATTGARNRVYLNDGTGIFTLKFSSDEVDVTHAIAFGDLDDDRDLDYIAGNGNNTPNRVYRNNTAAVQPNTLPTAPSSGFNATITPTGSTVSLTLSWNAGSDTETPAQSLQYVVRIGTTTGGNNVLSRVVGSPQYTHRMIPGGQSTTITMKGLACNRTYFWAVATRDSSLEGITAFSPEQQVFAPCICSNTADDDTDTFTDCADPGCHTDDDAANTLSCDPNGASEAHTPRCGNGVVDLAEEQCDNGLNNSDTTADACRLDCTNPRCGDGITDTGEQCDDGNTSDTDTCTNACLPAACGDGFTQPNGADGIPGTADDEQCDDGNTSNTDACNNSCQPTSCGDGVVQNPNGAGVAEQCDDGNTSNTDSCTTICRFPICGDGFTQPNGADGIAGTADDEQCDDGNTSNTDACNNSCQPTSCGDGIVQNPNGQGTAEVCDDGPLNGQPNQCNATCTGTTSSVCGNGIREAGEDCDDGNTSETDQCSNSCILTICGDGTVQNPNGQGVSEQCDDGCLAGIPEVCEPVDRGDGCSDICVVTVECSDGVENDGDTHTDCTDPGCHTDGNAANLTCDASDNTEGGNTARCGDGAIDVSLGEECDDGNLLEGDGCSATCEITTQCGDMVDNDTDSFIDCGDPGCHTDGNAANTISCDPFRVSETHAPGCPNGVVDQVSEQCDDGNLVNGDGCNSSCQVTIQCSDEVDNADLEDTLNNEADPGCYDNGNVITGTYDPLDNDETHIPVCGNGAVDQLSEQCDDGNTVPGDGCSESCLIEENCTNGIDDDSDGRTDCADPECSEHPTCDLSCHANDIPSDFYFFFEDPSLTVTPSPVCPVCGDGFVTAPEACDTNGNVGCALGSICEADCSACRVLPCGNGQIDPGEDCLNCPQDIVCGPGTQCCGDGQCLTECPTCGNGAIEPREHCDASFPPSDRGPIPGAPGNWLCDPQSCQLVYTCNNGVEELGEQCEAGEPHCTFNCEIDACAILRETSDPGFLGFYHNLPSWRYGMDDPAVIGPANPRPDQFLWFSPLYIKEVRREPPQLSFPYPFNGPYDGLPGDTFHHSAKWLGTVTVPVDGIYSYSWGSRDSAWAIIDGVVADAILGLQPTVGVRHASVFLTEGTHIVELLMVSRQGTPGNEGVFFFSFDNPALPIAPYLPGCSYCGNGIREAGEVCDDGTQNGLGEGFCNSTCTGIGDAICGNGVTETGETCDDGKHCADASSCLTDADCTDLSTCIPRGGDGCSDICEVEPACGNGIREGTEECDDANLTDGDGCSSTCTLENVCGNGIVQPGEQCDDGNTDAGDGCSSTCQLELVPCGNAVLEPGIGEECDFGGLCIGGALNGTACITPAEALDCALQGGGCIAQDDDADGCDAQCQLPQICGDSRREDPEECDEGALNSDTLPDRCRLSCRLPSCGDDTEDSGEQCDTGDERSDLLPDQCRLSCELPRCGDTVTDTGEECDQGVLNSDTAPDRCRLMCTLPVCGDTVPDPQHGEECDDGKQCDNGENCTTDEDCVGFTSIEIDGDEILIPILSGECRTRDDDGCDASCEFEPPVCGNSRQEVGEECDDGNTIDGDGCSSTCEVEVSLTCGDGVIQTENGEQCDDGNASDNDICNVLCRFTVCSDGIVQNPDGVGIAEQCDDANALNTDACTNVCESAACGDGYIYLGVEECDDGNSSPADTCSALCKKTSCGDGVKQQPNGFGMVEECDDGNAISADACTGLCKNAVCGDGFLYPVTEECDDGNRISGDGCAGNCTKEEVVGGPECGNGIRENREQCDDGNTRSGDGCSSSCNLESVCGNGIRELPEECDDGNLREEDGCSRSCILEPNCGNGQIEGGEECDDGNTVSSDGCSETCAREIIVSGCGNGIAEANEECDAGPANSDSAPDACRTTCTRSRCGDGTIDQSEQCDEGALNANVSSACRTNCRLPACGDGILDYRLNERCDDGNNVGGDSCSATCQQEVAVVTTVPPPGPPGVPTPPPSPGEEPPVHGVAPPPDRFLVTPLPPEYDEFDEEDLPTHALIGSLLSQSKGATPAAPATPATNKLSSTGPTALFFISLGAAGIYAFRRLRKKR